MSVTPESRNSPKTPVINQNFDALSSTLERGDYFAKTTIHPAHGTLTFVAGKVRKIGANEITDSFDEVLASRNDDLRVQHGAKILTSSFDHHDHKAMSSLGGNVSYRLEYRKGTEQKELFSYQRFLGVLPWKLLSRIIGDNAWLQIDVQSLALAMHDLYATGRLTNTSEVFFDIQEIAQDIAEQRGSN
ncbi:MAG: hypothetical protein HLX51_01320 [Micrococcaceae bacterium]|nr:hypothetical protein [Micrococcaceae bacterium]